MGSLATHGVIRPGDCMGSLRTHGVITKNNASAAQGIPPRAPGDARPCTTLHGSQSLTHQRAGTGWGVLWPREGRRGPPAVCLVVSAVRTPRERASEGGNIGDRGKALHGIVLEVL